MAPRGVPFSAATVLAWVLTPIGTAIVWPEYWVATALLALSGAMMALAWRLLGHQAVIPETLVFLAAVGLLRDASGGFRSGAAVLALIPILYAAHTSRSRRVLGAVLAAVVAFFVAPRLLIGGVDYPSSRYRSALLFALVAGTTGFAVQSLVAGVQAQAATARARGRMPAETAPEPAGQPPGAA